MRKVRWMAENYSKVSEMSRAARLMFEEKYTGAMNYQLLMGIYRQAVAIRGRLTDG